MTRRLLRAVAFGLIGVLLTAQMAIAAYACPAILRVASQVNLQDKPSEVPAVAVLAARAHCDMGGLPDSTAPNLCAEHCKYGQQIDHGSTLTVPAAVLAALYVVRPAPEVARPLPVPANLSALVAAAPPHAILHCVYRI